MTKRTHKDQNKVPTLARRHFLGVCKACVIHVGSTRRASRGPVHEAMKLHYIRVFLSFPRSKFSV